jgi:hypothetical protein
MARIRSVKPEFWLDPTLTRLSRDARMLYIALWNMADEHGRLLGDARVIKGQVFPYDDDLTPSRINELIGELIAGSKAVRYEIDDAPYVYLPNLSKHQRLEPEKVPSRLPAPPAQASDLHTPAHPDESARRADESARDADELSLLQVAGSREHVAGKRGAGSNAAHAARVFDEFWQTYPRKVGKAKAVKAWATATKHTNPDVILAGLKAQLPELLSNDEQFRPHPTTWLNAGRWEDEVGTATPTGELTVEAVANILGRESFQLPPPPEGIEAGTRAWQEWATRARDEWMTDRQRRAREIQNRRAS